MSNGSIPSPPQRDVILDVYDDQVNAIKKLTPWGAAGIYIKTEKTAENCMNLFSQELPLYKDHLSADTFDALEKTKLRVSTARDSLVSKLKRAREVTGEPFWKKPILVVTRSRDEIHAYRELTETFREVLMTASREARDKHRRAEVFAAVVHEEDMERNHIVTEMHESRNRNKTSQSSDRQENIDIPSNGTSPTRYDLAAIYNSKTGQYTDCNGNPLLHAPGAEPVRNAIIQACSQHLAREEALLQSDTKMETEGGRSVADASPGGDPSHNDMSALESEDRDDADSISGADITLSDTATYTSSLAPADHDAPSPYQPEFELLGEELRSPTPLDDDGRELPVMLLPTSRPTSPRLGESIKNMTFGLWG